MAERSWAEVTGNGHACEVYEYFFVYLQRTAEIYERKKKYYGLNAVVVVIVNGLPMKVSQFLASNQIRLGVLTKLL